MGSIASQARLPFAIGKVRCRRSRSKKNNQSNLAAKVRTFREVKSAKSDGCFSSFNPLGVLFESILQQRKVRFAFYGMEIKTRFVGRLSKERMRQRTLLRLGRAAKLQTIIKSPLVPLDSLKVCRRSIQQRRVSGLPLTGKKFLRLG